MALNQPGLRKIHVREKNRVNRQLPRYVVALLATSEVCFGLNFGYIKTTNSKNLRILSIFSGCFLIVIMAAALSVMGFPSWIIIFIFQYTATFLILLSEKYTIYELLMDLQETREPVDDNKMAWWFSLYVVLHIVLKMITTEFIRGDDVTLFLITQLMHIPTLALDLVPMANCILFYRVMGHVKDLREKLDRCVLNPKQVQTSYSQIADAMENLRSRHDGIFVCGFFNDSIKWIVLIYYHLQVTINSDLWALQLRSFAWALSTTMQICLPTLCAEMVSMQTDAIKAILCERILVETDEVEASHLDRLYRYLSARPLVTPAWRLVPLDLRLPTTMLSMCITYLIVIIQFTHLYD